MACQEIGQMREQVCASLRGSVDRWEHNLQARYGDPRVYAMQQAAMAQQEAAFTHDMTRRKNVTFEKGTYQDRTAAAKEAHPTRIKGQLSKNRGRKGSGKPPASAEAPPQTPPPAPAAASAPPPARPSPSS